VGAGHRIRRDYPPGMAIPASEEEWPQAVERLRGGLGEALGALAAVGRGGGPGLHRRPPGGGWSAREVLEHVALTDHFLLILVEKIAERTRRRLERGDPWPDGPPRFEHLQHLASSERDWEAPGHMVPSGDVEPAEAARTLTEDLRRATALLDEFPRGEGTLHRIRMSMVGGDDDRLDLYQYLEIVRLHAARHVGQVERALADAAG